MKIEDSDTSMDDEDVLNGIFRDHGEAITIVQLDKTKFKRGGMSSRFLLEIGTKMILLFQ